MEIKIKVSQKGKFKKIQKLFVSLEYVIFPPAFTDNKMALVGALEVHGVQPKDAGIYSCSATGVPLQKLEVSVGKFRLDWLID